MAYLLPPLLTLQLGGSLVDSRSLAAGDVLSGARWTLLAFSIAGLSAGVAGTARGPRPKSTLSYWRPASLALAPIGIVFLLVGTVSAGYFVLVVAGIQAIGQSSYGERYLLMEGHGLLLAGVSTTIVACLVLYADACSRGRRVQADLIGLVSLAMVGVWTMLIGARAPLIQLCLGLMIVRQALVRPMPKWAFVAGVLLLLAVGVGVGLLRAGIRDLPGLRAALTVAAINPANAEFGVTVGTIGDVVRRVPAQQPYRYGATYLQALGAILPARIWPGRPIGAGLWYVRSFYPEVADRGGAYGFSPVAEAYLNFGPPGVLAVFILLGAWLGWLDRRLASLDRHSPMATVAFASVAVALVLLSRLDAAALLKTYAVIILGQLGVIYVAARVLPELVSIAARRDTISARQ